MCINSNPSYKNTHCEGHTSPSCELGLVGLTGRTDEVCGAGRPGLTTSVLLAAISTRCLVLLAVDTSVGLGDEGDLGVDVVDITSEVVVGDRGAFAVGTNI